MNGPADWLAVAIALVSLTVSIGFSIRANKHSDAANEKADRANETAAQTREDSVRWNQPRLVPVRMEVTGQGTTVVVENRGNTPASEARLEWVGPHTNALFGFTPRPVPTIGAGAFETFECSAKKPDFLDGKTILDPQVVVIWTPPVGEPARLAVRLAPHFGVEGR